MIESENAWHLDKRVPIGIIIALIVQTAALLYTDATWRAETTSRLDALELAASDSLSERREQRRRMDLIERAQTSLDSKLTGLDERTRAIQRQTDRILGILLNETRRPGASE